MEQYRSRTSLNQEDLSRGILTLLVSSVQQSDSGEYRCSVPKWSASIIRLDVKKQQNMTVKDDFSTVRPQRENGTMPSSSGAGKKGVGAIVAVCLFALVLMFTLLLKFGKFNSCYRYYCYQGELRYKLNNDERGQDTFMAAPTHSTLPHGSGRNMHDAQRGTSGRLLHSRNRVPKDQHYRTKTDGFTTAKCPHEEPDNPGGKTINIVLGVVIFLVGVVVGVVVGVLIGIRRTKIQGWETTSSDGRMEAF
ncbi:hypothetical protein Q8A73_002893 [Channa argus]|nr:hypothetical protein Q8A73_002893 [Channa argus]